MRILIIEADSETQKKLTEIMEELGHDVVGSRPGQVALYDSRSNPDVVFLDMDATLVQGIEYLDIIRVENPNAKVVLTTTENYEVDPIRVGAVATMRKPIRPHMLRKLLRHLESVFFCHEPRVPVLRTANRTKMLMDGVSASAILQMEAVLFSGLLVVAFAVQFLH